MLPPIGKIQQLSEARKAFAAARKGQPLGTQGRMGEEWRMMWMSQWKVFSIVTLYCVFHNLGTVALSLMHLYHV